MNIEDYKTQELVKKYNFKFSKSLGQNFLIDESVLNDIVDGADVTREDLIIEIGPGVGTLTAQLLRKAKRVVSIELDNDLIPILEGELGGNDNFSLIHKDALKVDFKEIIGDEKSVKLVANLPYYVTTPIIIKLLKEGYNFKNLTIMIQKEVAERIDAKPSSKEYGSLSLFVQYYCNTKIIRKVPPTCFIPRPKVDSVVIRLDKLKEPAVKVKDEKLMFDIIRNSFNMRRKTLWNGVKFLGIPKEKLEKAFENSGIDCKRRGETLSLKEFAELSDAILDIK
ncbi:MAG: 16S rRNA (adenine(1518)-N(6)/adenine(1519)-N(6))-dimethyltransferase RsmA [Clostridiales bacterium]|nr:16S rRNA (adenine(1518)-N(6)/adenine(1519)-N(6))-dimethyltransferase RsmA [Clostridiales bacterium]